MTLNIYCGRSSEIGRHEKVGRSRWHSKGSGQTHGQQLELFSTLVPQLVLLGIALLIGAMQVLIMFVGGAAFSVVRQTPGQWATAIICGFIDSIGWSPK